VYDYCDEFRPQTYCRMETRTQGFEDRVACQISVCLRSLASITILQFMPVGTYTLAHERKNTIESLEQNLKVLQRSSIYMHVSSALCCDERSLDAVSVFQKRRVPAFEHKQESQNTPGRCSRLDDIPLWYL
jgi:hypothetical protein